MNKKQKKMLARIIIAAVLLIVLHFVPITGIPRFICYLAVYLVIGYDIVKKAFKGIKNGQVFDENFLMAIATIGAFALAVYEKSSCWYFGSGSFNVFWFSRGKCGILF